MTNLQAEIIAIGDEMTSGARLDTNTQWLCQRLTELGIIVRSTKMVGDDLGANIEAFADASRRVDIVIATGGLGPTADDLTRESIAAAAQVPLEIHAASLQHIETLFAARARPMPPRNRVQAMLPQGAIDIFNPRGTAPGIDLTVTRSDGGCSRIFALPGVPAEMKEMFEATVGPRIVEFMGARRRIIRNAIIKCFGLGESEMEARLGDMISRQAWPRVGITVSAATISLRISAQGDTPQQCETLIESTRQEIHGKVGEYVFGEGEEFELQHAVAQQLGELAQTLATVEFGHAAPIANWFADIPNTAVYRGGRVSPNSTVVTESLRQIRDKLRADWLLAVDRYPATRDLCGENAGTPSEVSISVIGPNVTDDVRESHRLGGHPSIVHARIGKAALAMLRARLSKKHNEQEQSIEAATA